MWNFSGKRMSSVIDTNAFRPSGDTKPYALFYNAIQNGSAKSEKPKSDSKSSEKPKHVRSKEGSRSVSEKKQLLQYAIETDIEQDRDDDDENMIKLNKKENPFFKKARHVPYRHPPRKGVAICQSVVQICFDDGTRKKKSLKNDPRLAIERFNLTVFLINLDIFQNWYGEKKRSEFSEMSIVQILKKLTSSIFRIHCWYFKTLVNLFQMFSFGDHWNWDKFQERAS